MSLLPGDVGRKSFAVHVFGGLPGLLHIGQILRIFANLLEEHPQSVELGGLDALGRGKTAADVGHHVDARFAQRRDVGQEAIALFGGDIEHPELVDGTHHIVDVSENHVDFPAEQRRVLVCGTLVEYAGQLGVGILFAVVEEHQVVARQRADEADADLAGVFTSCGDDFAGRLVGAVLADGDALGIVDDLANVLEAVRGELGVLRQRLEDDVGDVQAADGVAVRAGLGYFRKPDDASRTGLVHEHPRLRRILIPVLLHNPSLYVARTARSEGDDHVNRFLGIGRRCGHSQQPQQTQRRTQTGQQFHRGSPYLSVIQHS